MLFCATVIADQITLKNGDRISGTVVQSDGKVLVFKGDLTGDLSIALSDVIEIMSDKKVYVGLSDGSTLVGTLAANNGQTLVNSPTGSVSLTNKPIAFIRSEAEQLKYEDSLSPGLLEHWTGGADLGLAITKGNSDTTNIAMGLGISRETPNDKTTLYAAAIYNRDSTDGDSRTVANALRFGGRYDRNFDE